MNKGKVYHLRISLIQVTSIHRPWRPACLEMSAVPLVEAPNDPDSADKVLLFLLSSVSGIAPYLKLLSIVLLFLPYLVTD